MHQLLAALTAILFVSCSSTSTTPEQVEANPSPTFVEKSNQVAFEVATGDADRYPEGASAMGYHQYDHKAMQLEDDMETKDLAHYQSWIQKLDQMLSTEQEPEMRTDLLVLKEKMNQLKTRTELSQKYNEIDYYPVSKNVYSSLQKLVNPQSSIESLKAAVDRFKAYVQGQNSVKPFAVAAQSRAEYLMKTRTQKPFFPLRIEIEQYLKDSPEYVKGIAELLKASGRTDWQETYDQFKVQVQAYDSFLKKTMLPKSRKDPRFPPEIYAQNIKSRGIQTSPEELIHMATTDFKVVYQNYQTLAQKLAKKYKLRKSDPASVIQHLKKDQVTRPQDVEALYQEASRTLTDLIQKHDLATLPAAPLQIRMAGDAESKANPVPHLSQPPLVNNKGERPEFVVPSSSTGKLPFDDFSYKASALILTAHEGRPGHDLQFSSILDRGTSLIRARYAANNVNIEGWALYAEDLVFPHLPEESQFAALQTRLWRIARAFLDPQVQLGKASEKTVLDVFTKQLGVSQAMAKLEYQRYAFDDVGQAPSYYYGLKKILVMKEETMKRLGNQFKEKCFSDAILSYGLLPLDTIAERLQKLDCAAGSVALGSSND